MFILGFVTVITSVIFLLTLWWYLIYYKYKKYLEIFPTPRQLPLLGIAYNMQNNIDFFRNIQSMIKEMGKNVFVMIGPFPALITADPKIFATVLGNSKHIHKPFFYKSATDMMAPNSLLIANGDEWRRQRKLFNPTLDYKNVMDNIPRFNKHSNNLINTLKAETENESTELVHIMEEFTFRQTLDTLFNDFDNEVDKKVILDCMKSLVKIVIRKAFFPFAYLKVTYIFSKMYWEERRILKIIHDGLYPTIEKKRKEHRNGLNIKRRPKYLDVLINENYTDEFIESQIKLGITAAVDTSSVTLSFALYVLAKSPEIQQKAFEEIESILGDDIQQEIKFQQISEMKYLDLIIKESMRLYSTVPLYIRTLQEDVRYEQTVLPKGLMVIMAPFMMHVDPDLYSDPDKFNPERFLKENMNPNRYSYAPFNLGVRNCIGKMYAMVSIKIALAKLLLNYEFVDVHHQLYLCLEMTLQSQTGVRVGVRKRSSIGKNESVAKIN